MEWLINFPKISQLVSTTPRQSRSIQLLLCFYFIEPLCAPCFTGGRSSVFSSRSESSITVLPHEPCLGEIFEVVHATFSYETKQLFSFYVFQALCLGM